MRRALRLGGFALTGPAMALSWASPLAAVERNMPGATVESVIILARRLSPELAAAALDSDAAEHRVGAAGALPDPTLTLQAWDMNGRGVGQRWIGVEQEFKLWGKLDLERGVAEADAEAARHQSRAVATDLIAGVKTAYAQYAAAHRAIDLSHGLKRPLDEILGLLRLRYGASSVDQQEVFKAEIEAATAETEVARRQGEAKSAAARLNALIGRDSLASLAIPRGFRPLKTKLTLAGVQELARAANPVLATTSAQVRAATGTKLTDLNYYPDVMVGANFVQRPTGDNSGMFTLGFKAPLQYEAKDAEQRAASSRLGAAQMRYDAIRRNVAETWFGLEAVRKTIRIVEQRQVPPACLLAETAASGFQPRTTDLAAVLDAQCRLRAVKFELLKLKVEEARYAELERLAGGSL